MDVLNIGIDGLYSCCAPVKHQFYDQCTSLGQILRPFYVSNCVASLQAFKLDHSLEFKCQVEWPYSVLGS